MEEQTTSDAKVLAAIVYGALILIPTVIVWGASGSALAGLLIAGLVGALLLMSNWGGGRPIHKRLRTTARDESAPYDEPPDRPLSRWQ